MTDRYKGVLVIFERDIRSDDAKKHIEAIKMIRGVSSVKPYVAKGEDYMLYERGYRDAQEEIYKWLSKPKERPI
jgi:hypothetical protein